MASLKRYMPDAKIVVGFLAASYIAAVLFSVVPSLSPTMVASKFAPRV